MKNEIRLVRYDADCRVEAYWFRGILQPFPNHFHDYYVIGSIEKGRRCLLHGGREYALEAGDVVLFNPRENHACAPADESPFDYRCLNVAPEDMQNAAREITGGREAPRFAAPVVYHSDLAETIRELHGRIMRRENGFRKEELFYLLLSQLLADDAVPAAPEAAERSGGVAQEACAYFEEHFERTVTLDELGALFGYSKYHFLRAFTKEKGITPYAYLETVRIGKAKELLQSGVLPAEAAARAGFADQSHLSNAFKRYIGLTPKQYWRIFAAEPKRMIPPDDAANERGEYTDEPLG